MVVGEREGVVVEEGEEGAHFLLCAIYYNRQKAVYPNIYNKKLCICLYVRVRCVFVVVAHSNKKNRGKIY